MSAVFTHFLAFMAGCACGVFVMAIVVVGGGHDD